MCGLCTDVQWWLYLCVAAFVSSGKQNSKMFPTAQSCLRSSGKCELPRKCNSTMEEKAIFLKMEAIFSGRRENRREKEER